MQESVKTSEKAILTKRFIALVICVLLTGVGASFMIKADIGVGAWDALAMSIGFLTGIEVGTVGMMMNITCVILQILILTKLFKIKNLLQVPMSILIGIVVNYIIYQLLSTLEISNYFMNLALMLAGLIIVCFTISAIMLIDLITFPLEGLSMSIVLKSKYTFGMVRQVFDVLCVVLSLGMSFLLHTPLTVREGTIISMLLFGPLVTIIMRWMKPLFRRMDLTDL